MNEGSNPGCGTPRAEALRSWHLTYQPLILRGVRSQRARAQGEAPVELRAASGPKPNGREARKKYASGSEADGRFPMLHQTSNNQGKALIVWFLWYFLRRSRKKSVPQWIGLMCYGLALLSHCYTIIFYSLIDFIVLPALKMCFYEISLTVVLSPKWKRIL